MSLKVILKFQMKVLYWNHITTHIKYRTLAGIYYVFNKNKYYIHYFKSSSEFVIKVWVFSLLNLTIRATHLQHLRGSLY